MRAFFSSPKARPLPALVALLGVACAPESPRPAEILAALAAGSPEATLPAEALVDSSTPSGLPALLQGAQVDLAAVDGDASTVVARVHRAAWARCSEVERRAWLARVDLLPSGSGEHLALRFHFVRRGPRWHLDLRRLEPQR